MTIQIDDQVTVPAQLALGSVLRPATTGIVMLIKPDYFGKSNRKVAVVKTAAGDMIEVFVSALSKLS